MSYRIGSFNLLNFSGRTEKDLDAVANIIAGEQFDIVALQEVLNPTALTMLLRRLPWYWEGRQSSPRSSKEELEWNEAVTSISTSAPKGVKKSANTAKGYAYLWNTRRFRECSKSGPQIFEQIKNGSLVRNPFYGRFTSAGLPGGTFCELRLVNVHLCSPAENKAARMNEYSLITNEVLKRIGTKRYGDNRPAYTIALGDYNMPVVWCTGDDESTFGNSIITQQEEKTTLSKENDFANDYDHFSYDLINLSDIEFNIKRVNVVEKYYRNDFTKYHKQVSDHVPVKMEMELNSGY
jgi:endonuclease/exonuclease/phosphatase family metal-dependent hydrolase